MEENYRWNVFSLLRASCKQVFCQGGFSGSWKHSEKFNVKFKAIPNRPFIYYLTPIWINFKSSFHNICQLTTDYDQVVRDTVRVLRLQHKTLARAFAQKNTSESYKLVLKLFHIATISTKKSNSFSSLSPGNLHEFFSVLFLDILVNIQVTTLVSLPTVSLNLCFLPRPHSP